MADEFVDRLVVGVGYKTDKRSLKEVESDLGRAFSGLTTLAAGLLAAAAGGTIFAIAQAASIDETAKLAAQLRTTTEELTAAQFAAARSGIEHTRLTETMIRLDTVIGMAANGSEREAAAFAALGLSAHNADGSLRTAIGSLVDIAGGLESLGDEARQSEVLLTLFGEQGARLRPLLSGGASSVRELTAEAERLGLVLSTEAGEEAERLMDSMEGLRGVLRGMRWQIAGEIIPTVTEGADALTDWLIASDGIVQVGLDRSLRGLGWTLDQLRTPMGQATAGAIALAGAIGAARGASIVASTIPGGAALGRMAAALGPFALKAGLAAGTVALAAIAVDDLLVFLDGGDSVVGRFFERFGDPERDALAQTHSLLNAMTDSGDSLVGVLQRIDEQALALFGETFREAYPELKGIAGLIAHLEASRLQDKIDAWTKGFQRLGSVLDTIAESFNLQAFAGGAAIATGNVNLGAGMIRDAATGESGRIRGLVGNDDVARAGGVASGALRSLALTVAPNLTLQSGNSRREIIEEVEREIRKMLTRELDTVEAGTR